MFWKGWNFRLFERELRFVFSSLENNLNIGFNWFVREVIRFRF